MTSYSLFDYKAFFFDLDGCIYNSDVLNTGSVELVNQLRSDQKKVCFVTNNSRQTAIDLAAKLSIMGLQVEPEEIFTATDYVGKYIKRMFGCVLVKVAGSRSLQESIQNLGHRVLSFDNQDQADVVVIGRDTQFDYKKLQSIINEVENGAHIISTNPDFYHPSSQGKKVPETGALVASIEAILSKKIQYFGKPTSYLFEYSMKACEVEPQDSIMIGDNLATDITGGKLAGMKTVWINGQYPTNHPYDSRPDYVVQNMEQLLALYTKKADVFAYE